MTEMNYGLLLDKTAKAPLRPPVRKTTLLAVMGTTKRGSATSHASMQVIADAAGVSLNTVRTALKDLNEMLLVSSKVGARSAAHTVNERLVMSFGNALAGEALFPERTEPKKPETARTAPVTDEDIPAELLELIPSEPAPAAAPVEGVAEIRPIEGPYRSEKQARYAAATRLYLRHCDHEDRTKGANGRKARRAQSEMTAKKIRAFDGVLRVAGITEELVADAIDGVFANDWHVQNGHTDVRMICAEKGGRISKYAALKKKAHLGGELRISPTADLNAQWGRPSPLNGQR